MAQGNYRQYLKADRVWIKKYFYVLRPILAVNWIVSGLGVAPTEFGTLIDGLPLDLVLKTAIDDLLEAKRAGAELDYGPRIPPISNFIESELARLESTRFEFAKNTASTDVLDELFLSTIRDAWA